jgi:hypothetical protein
MKDMKQILISSSKCFLKRAKGFDSQVSLAFTTLLLISLKAIAYKIASKSICYLLLILPIGTLASSLVMGLG